MKLRYVLIAFSTLLLAACSVRLSRDNRTRTDEADVVMQDFIYTVIGIHGRANWELKAQEGHFFLSDKSKSESVALYFFTITFYKEDGSPDLFMTGNYGKLDQKTLNFVGIGNVTALNADSTEINAHRIFWNHQRELMYTHPDDKVNIFYSNTVIEGYGMQMDLKTDLITLNNTYTDIDNTKPPIANSVRVLPDTVEDYQFEDIDVQ